MADKAQRTPRSPFSLKKRRESHPGQGGNLATVVGKKKRKEKAAAFPSEGLQNQSPIGPYWAPTGPWTSS